jgi:hypothetical protein
MLRPAMRQRATSVEPWSWRIRPSRGPWLTGLIPEADHAAALRVRATATRRSVRRSCCSALDPTCCGEPPSWTATRSGRHGSSSNCPARTTPRWRRRGTMRDPLVRQRVRSKEKRERARVLNAGSARGSSCTHHSSARFLFLTATNFLRSSVYQPIAPPTLARHRRVFVA